VLRWWDGESWGGQAQPVAGSAPGPQQPSPGGEYGYTPPGDQGPRRSRAGRHKAATAVITALGLFILFIIIGAAAGSHSSAGRAPAQAAAPSSSPAASTAATAGICTTRGCIVSDAQTGLTGSVAKDESVGPHKNEVPCRQREAQPRQHLDGCLPGHVLGWQPVSRVREPAAISEQDHVRADKLGSHLLCGKTWRGSLVIVFLWTGLVTGDGQADARARFRDGLLDVLSTGIPGRLVTYGHARQVGARLHVERQAFGPGHLAGRRDGQRHGGLVTVRRGICRVVSGRARQRRLRWLRNR